jgi:hypothetical protein
MERQKTGQKNDLSSAKNMVLYLEPKEKTNYANH